MNFIEEYEAELAAKAKAEIEAEDRAWNAKPREERDLLAQAMEAERLAEEIKQGNIRLRFEAEFGPDDEEDDDDEDA